MIDDQKNQDKKALLVSSVLKLMFIDGQSDTRNFVQVNVQLQREKSFVAKSIVYHVGASNLQS